NQGIIVSSDGRSSRFRWNSWNGTTWGTSATQALSGKLLWATLRRDVGSDNMAITYVDNANNVGVVRWTGAAWTGQTNLATADSTADRGVDNVFENTGARNGFIMVPYSNTTAAQYQYWNGTSWSGAATLASIARSATISTVRDGQNTVLAIFFDHIN